MMIEKDKYCSTATRRGRPQCDKIKGKNIATEFKIENICKGQTQIKVTILVRCAFMTIMKINILELLAAIIILLIKIKVNGRVLNEKTNMSDTQVDYPKPKRKYNHLKIIT